MPNGNSSLIWGAWAGSITAVVGAFFALRRLFHWQFPIRIEPFIIEVLDGSGPHEIRAKIINRSRAAQYVVSCNARSTYPLSTIVSRHIHMRKPLVPPRLYPAIWFTPPSFSLLESEPQKLEHFEPVELRHRLSHPLTVFLTPMLQVEVRLATGRTIRSRRLRSGTLAV